MQFVKVSRGSPLLSLVEEQFRKVIEPLYGNQDKAIEQIKKSSDRHCYVLMVDNIIPVGIIVYKTKTSDEYAKYDVEQSIEIKSLFVIEENANRGRGFGKKLLDKVVNYARENGSNGVHVTVGDKVPQSIRFFERNSFQIVHTWNGRYLPDVNEHLLHFDCEKRQD